MPFPSIVAILSSLVVAVGLQAQRARHEGSPIHYDQPAEHGPIERLAKAIGRGEVSLARDEKTGFLESLLRQLRVPISSQTLVFSKTSAQHHLISPARPRAVFFADDVYVGWIPGAPFIEVTSIDPERGPVFYALPQTQTGPPKFERRADCMSCHASTRTHDWPGNLVRSVHTDRKGLPILRAGTFLTTHESPLRERWGGWYVSGVHGKQPHLGNATVAPGKETVRLGAGSNLTDLTKLFDTRRYLSPHSDIVALMVLEHQAEMHNRIARTSYQARLELSRKLDARGKARLQTLAERLVEYLLFTKEARIRATIRGTSSFARDFAAKAKRDSRGRSLRDFDLRRRMFRYPCSYLIHGRAFNTLPAPVLVLVYRRLWNVLKGRPKDDGYRRLSRSRRAAILEILLETKVGLPAYWRS